MTTSQEKAGAADQRYYYAVGLDLGRTGDASKLRPFISRSTTPSVWARQLALEGVELFGWDSEEPFGSAESHESFKVRRSGGKYVYHYDFWAVSLRIGKRSAALVGFPYVGLGKTVIRDMVAAGLLKESLFVTTSPQRVTDRVGKGETLEGGIRIAKLVCRVEDEAVKRIAIGGKDAVHSRIYKQLIRQFGGKTFRAEHCSVAFELDGEAGLRTHLDQFGNYRLWMQQGLRNVASIPPLFRYFEGIEALDSTTSIPHERLAPEEGGEND